MKIDWSAYRITLLLYIGILLLPISFYFSYTSFKEIQEDTKILNKLILNNGAILTLNYNVSDLKKQKIIKEIDKTFKDLRPWMLKNNSKDFYVGSSPLLKKYDSISSSWTQAKTANPTMFLSLYEESKILVFSLSNMLELKQNKIYYLFYINLFLTMALLLSLIFFARIYIYQQLSKHAIYDLKTNLYTKDYLLATLKEMIAKSLRTQEELSALYISVYELKDAKNAQKDKVLKYIGASLLDSLRVSDVTCRYGEYEFVVILPNTQEENFEILINRLYEDLGNIKCEIKAIRYNSNESHSDFLERLI